MNPKEREQAEAKFGKIAKILHTAIILQEGWELDNRGWLVEMETGCILALTTNHGGICLWARDEAEEQLRKTNEAGTSLTQALSLWPVPKNDPQVSPQ
jgi:hypothetical protein